MPSIDNAAVEAEARALLRDLIWHSAWYPNLPAPERRERIEQDVDRFWPVMVHEAVESLLDRAVGEAQEG